MSRLLNRTAMLTMIVVIVLMTLRAVGSLNVPQAVLILGAEGCKPSCWNGIRPGDTSLGRAEMLLRADTNVVNLSRTPYTEELCWHTLAAPFWRSCARHASDTPGDMIDWIKLELPPDALQLGDAIKLFHDPLTIEQCPVRNFRTAGVPRQFIATYLSFSHNIRLMAYNTHDPTSQELAPDMVVLRILYYSPTAALSQDNGARWRGFTSFANLRGTCEE